MPIFYFALKGLQIPERKRNLSECKVRDAIILKEEPSNEYDHNAIQVFHGQKLLGYVERDKTLEVKNLMDGNYTAEISMIVDMNGFIEVTIGVYYF
ncbi:MAG TPA: HIRAN domain-containing protein [Chitinophagaceae bacterium]|nr:HIRAN domain-containing protein [Chitinophagaceae bacterium]